MNLTNRRIAMIGLTLWVASPACANSTYETDLDRFETLFINQDKALDTAARSEAERHMTDLRGRAASMSVEQVRLELMQIVALADNAGSLVLDNPSAPALPRLPIRLGWFPDGWLILRALPEHSNVAGARLLAIDGVDIDEVTERLLPYYGGLASRRMTMIPMLIERPTLLHAAGIAGSPDQVSLSLRLADGSMVEHRIAATAPLLAPFWPDRWSSEGFDATQQWTHAVDAKTLPLYLQDFEQPRRVAFLDDIRSAYVQVKWTPKARDASTDEVAKMLAAVRARRPAHFIVDLRFDHGGSTPELIALLKSETAYYRDRGSAIWIVTGRHTHESGIVAAAAIDDASDKSAKIVGEPVGDRLAFWASAGRDCLDSVGICVIHAARRFDVADGCSDPSCQDEYRGYRAGSLEPDIPVDMTIASYLTGQDPMLAAIRQHIDRPK